MLLVIDSVRLYLRRLPSFSSSQDPSQDPIRNAWSNAHPLRAKSLISMNPNPVLPITHTGASFRTVFVTHYMTSWILSSKSLNFPCFEVKEPLLYIVSHIRSSSYQIHLSYHVSYFHSLDISSESWMRFSFEKLDLIKGKIEMCEAWINFEARWVRAWDMQRR